MSDPLLSHLLGRDDSPEAVRFGVDALSSADLLERAHRVAAGLLGLRAVAVRATPTLDMVVATVAGLLAGVPVVPVPADSGPDETRYLLEDSGADLFLTETPDDSLPVPTAPLGDLRGTAGLPSVAGDSTALIVYTSGTTGRPKGVQLSHRAIAADLDALVAAWHWTPDDVLVHGLPLFHVHGLVLGVLGALRVGSPLRHTVRPTPRAYAEAGGSLYFGVPTVWGRLVQEPQSAARLRSARLLVSGSAALPAPVFDGLRELTGHRPVERYGMTESLITLSTRADGERRRGWVGQPLDGVQVRLVTDAGDPAACDAETPANLQVRGATLFDGYLGRPEATAACFTADGWFDTGDLAVGDRDGWYRIVGRAAVDLISSGGYRIGAGEIEDALLAHPAVREAAVIGTPDPDLGELVTAFVVADGVSEQQLSELVSNRLSSHKRPRRWVFVETLPRNAMGKVVKAALRER